MGSLTKFVSSLQAKLCHLTTRRRTTPSRSRLEILNDDVLVLMASEARQNGSLCALSTTCRRWRALSSPILFHKVVIGRPNGYDSRDMLSVPKSLLCVYVRILILQGYLPKNGWIVDAQFLVRILPAMCVLHTVILRDITGEVPWELLSAISSIPSLRVVEILRSSWKPIQEGEDTTSASSPMSLEKFVFVAKYWREWDLSRGKAPVSVWKVAQEESKMLEPFLSRTYTHLRTLHLQSESAPYSWMASLSWPHLQELFLIGKPPLSKSSILMEGQDHEVIIPKDAVVPLHTIISFIEELTLTYPNLDDIFFEHIPSELRRLSLRDCPRNYHFIDPVFTPHRWDLISPIPSSEDLLRILRRLHLPRLEELEIVYQANDDERALLAHIAISFPLLKRLELYRYRGTSPGPIVSDIFKPLSALPHLQDVRAYFEPLNGFHPHTIWLSIPETSIDELHANLSAFAHALYPQLRTVGLLVLHESSIQWWTWNIEYDHSGRFTTHFVDKSRSGKEFAEDERLPIQYSRTIEHHYAWNLERRGGVAIPNV
ncbi:hypothetical protein OF83DRAFT_1285202 [Amylostereum chailletii]|nr:hypothetical protein OF83DRAFT_1285202 [Amylostereum chailletii]